MTDLQRLLAVVAITGIFTACKKDKDPVIIIPPSEGAQVQLGGITSSQTAAQGSSAGNSIYLDLSTDKTTAVYRFGWDLGFYSGTDFRVVLNNTTSAAAKVLTKNDLTTVGAADTVGLTLAVNQAAPAPSDLAYFDDVAGDLTKTVIPAVSVTDADNKVIILNRGAGGFTGNLSSPSGSRAWVKLRVLRNTSGGYTLQYAGIQEATFKTLQIAKDADHHFKFVSFESGIVDAQPEKDKWDITWGYSVYQTNFGGGTVPYNFSDLIAVNYLSGVTVAEKIYTDATTAAVAFTAFNKDSVAKTTMITGRWTIGSNWRVTQSPTEPLGARTGRFYVIKDINGNYYKLKCLSMGSGNDGGTRGRPEFNYTLIK